MNNLIFIKEVDADASGKADMGELNPGNYYIYSIAEVSGVIYEGELMQQITANKDVELTVILTAKK